MQLIDTSPIYLFGYLVVTRVSFFSLSVPKLVKYISLAVTPGGAYDRDRFLRGLYMVYRVR